jgi:outer membrane protein, heavy metal efflux system
VKHRAFITCCALLFAIHAIAFAAIDGNKSPDTILVRHYTIEQATQLALRNNPEIKTAVRQVSLAESKSVTAGSLDDPMFMYRDWGTPLKQPWDLNQAQHMFSLQQTFPGSGKRLARTRIAKDDVEAQREQLESLRQEISAKLRKSFIDLLRNADELRLHNQQAALLHDAVATATSKYTVGKVPQADVLRAQIVETKLTDHLIQLEQERDLARAELNTLMGIDPSTAIKVVGDYRPAAKLPGIVELEQMAVAHRPELAGMRDQVKTADDQTRLAKLAYKPDYTVALGYMLNPAGAMARNNYMAEFTVSLPWLNKQKHDSEIQQADVAAEVSRSEFEVRRSAVFLEVESAAIKVRAAQRSVKLYRDTLTPQAEATFQAALVAYQNDRADFLSLIDSQNMLLDVQTSFFKASADADSRLADLERAVGTPLTADSQLATNREEQ